MAGMPTADSGGEAYVMPAFGYARRNGALTYGIDFSNSSDFTGAAKSTGWTGKLGAVYKVSPAVTLGASYQFESSLGDMKTGASSASLSAAGGFLDRGRITMVDFQWPATAAVGMAWQATPALLLAADVKRLDWAGVMKGFKLRYDSAGTSMPGVSGSVSFALPQNWKAQTVTNLGVAYAVNSALTLRGGLNLADNPIPDATVNPLFPATVKAHCTAGVGYRFSPASEFNGSLTVAPNSSVTNGQGVVISHKQLNAQLMYRHRF